MTSMTSRLPPMTTTTTMKTNKDSFDRFGDDLTGLLLAKLPTLADRMRLECVCRQWQRLVYNGQRELIIDKQFVDKWLGIAGTVWPQYYWHIRRRSADRRRKKYLDYKSRLLAVTKKLLRLRAIKLVNDDIDQIMTLLVNSYYINTTTDGNRGLNNIKSLEIHSPYLNSQTDLQSLIVKIGKFRQLRHLAIDLSYSLTTILTDDMLKTLADNCPAIRSLTVRVYCSQQSIAENLLESGVQQFPLLERLQLGIYMINTDQPLSVKSLANDNNNNNCPRLKHLSLECSLDMDFTDIDLINRQLIRPASVRKVDCDHIFLVL
ncbi:uncharacterized protein LOC128956504 [Oppia nitens]|uniref:uncharacterized protein LOC128956504 n=1 Tax=Oppia nitens TaxID=1686743 RepID=UPI0023DC1B2E|nr:uncharacterized protein LOC128956504 [Oppia nitens]